MRIPMLSGGGVPSPPLTTGDGHERTKRDKTTPRSAAPRLVAGRLSGSWMNALALLAGNAQRCRAASRAWECMGRPMKGIP